MKIYFAGSIRGGRDDKDLYQELITYLKEYGTVLTEHIGKSTLLETGETEPSDEWIFERDMKWIEQSDVLIAEVTTPSLGVGYEIGRAEAMGKNLLCLYRPQNGKRLSAMISGNSKANTQEYQTLEEAKQVIDKFFL